MDPTVPPIELSGVQFEEEKLAATAPPDPSKQSMNPPPYAGAQQAYPQQASYPQQGLEYSQQQGPYPTQQQPQAGYPQQQYPPSTYPVQQPGYPPQQQGYVQQQTAYPLNAPPPYYPQTQPGPAQQQRTQTNVVVVQQQPQVIRTAPVYASNPAANNANVLAITFTIIFLVCGCWWAIVCTVPAIIFASNAQSASTRGDDAAAKSNTNISFGCSAAGIIFAILVPIIFFCALFAR